MDIIILFILLILLAAVVFLITRKKDGNSELESNIEEESHKNSDLEQKLAAKEVEINNLQRDNIDIANTKLDEFGQIKTEKIQIAERLQNIDRERNQLKTKITSLEAKEESRNNELKKSLECLAFKNL